MRVFVFAVYLLCAFNLNAQGWKKKVFGNKNQFEIGNNVTFYPSSYFDNRNNFSSNLQHYYMYRSMNYFLNYTRDLKNDYNLSVDFIQGSNYNPENPADWDLGEIIFTAYKLFNLAFGKQFRISKFEFNPRIYLSYRYFGGQGTIIGYRNPGSLLSEPFLGFLFYNSVGGAVGMDINYIFTKHFGLGVKTSYNFYPFEDAKLSSIDDSYEPDPLLVATHKPLNQMVLLHFKLIGRF